MKSKRYLFLILLLAISNIGFTQSSEIGNSVDIYLSRMVPFGFNGTVLISDHGKILLNKGYGLANPATGKPNGPEMLYSLGSIVKPFTASMIMKLAQDGRISLTDAMSKYFKDIPEDKKGIMIHHLLSHSSGFPGEIGADTEFIERDEFISSALDSKLDFQPGERYGYSNVAFTLLAIIIEEVTGKDYQIYLSETILDPAGMKHTGYRVSESDRKFVAHNMTNGNDNGTFIDREYYPTWHLIGNGGILSTTEDMYLFYKFIESDQFLNAKTKATMFKPRFMEDAYGWVNIDDGEIIQHNGGGMDGNGALFQWFPKDDIFIMIFTNSDFLGKPGFLAIEQPILSLVFGEEITMPPEISNIHLTKMDNLQGRYRLANTANIELISGLNSFRLLPKDQMGLSLLFSNNEKDWSKWNIDIQTIMNEMLVKRDIGGLNKITNNPERFSKEIWNELEMEGYNNPKAKVLYSINIRPGIDLTKVAIYENDTQGGNMIFSFLFKDDIFAGLGVDFGKTELPGVTFIPTNQHHFIGYSFELNKKIEIDLHFDKNQKPVELSTDSVNWISMELLK